MTADPLDLIQALIDAHVDFQCVVWGEFQSYEWDPDPYDERGWWTVEHIHGFSRGRDLVLKRPGPPPAWKEAYLVLDGDNHFGLGHLSKIIRNGVDREPDVVVWTGGQRWTPMANTLFHARNGIHSAANYVEGSEVHRDLYFRAMKCMYEVDDLKHEVERIEREEGDR